MNEQNAVRADQSEGDPGEAAAYGREREVVAARARPRCAPILSDLPSKRGGAVVKAHAGGVRATAAIRAFDSVRAVRREGVGRFDVNLASDARAS